MGAPPIGAQTTTLVVTSAASTGNGLCDADCTLRDAIRAANAGSGPARIVFAIGSGPVVIHLDAPLPDVTAPGAVIDGRTQPGYDGAPLIYLEGGALAEASGLVSRAAGRGGAGAGGRRLRPVRLPRHRRGRARQPAAGQLGRPQPRRGGGEPQRAERPRRRGRRPRGAHRRRLRGLRQPRRGQQRRWSHRARHPRRRGGHAGGPRPGQRRGVGPRRPPPAQRRRHPDRRWRACDRRRRRGRGGQRGGRVAGGRRRAAGDLAAGVDPGGGQPHRPRRGRPPRPQRRRRLRQRRLGRHRYRRALARRGQPHLRQPRGHRDREPRSPCACAGQPHRPDPGRRSRPQQRGRHLGHRGLAGRAGGRRRAGGGQSHRRWAQRRRHRGAHHPRRARAGQPLGGRRRGGAGVGRGADHHRPRGGRGAATSSYARRRPASCWTASRR